MSSWFRRSLSRKKEPKSPQIRSAQQEEDQLLGVTQQLVDFVKSFTLETFKNFPLQDEEGNDEASATPSRNVSKDLSEWQERHAVLVLSTVNVEYEMRAAQLAMLEEREREQATISEASAYEVEMAETKQFASLTPATP